MSCRNPTVAILGLLLGLAPALAQDSPTKAQELFKSALAENRNKNFSAAFKLLTDAQKEDPNVLAQDDEGLLQNVESWLQEQVDKNSGDADAHFQMAELRVLQGMPEDALKHYELVVSLSPGSPLAALAQPLVDDLKTQGAGRAAAAPTGASGPSGATPEAGPPASQLQTEIDRLQSELSNAQNEIATLKSQVAAQTQPTDSATELERLKQEFTDYKKQAENWRTFHNLYFAEKGRR